MNMVKNAGKTLDWTKANECGRERASALIDKMVETENPALLGWAFKEIIGKGEFGGVEVGFANKLAEALIIGGRNG